MNTDFDTLVKLFTNLLFTYSKNISFAILTLVIGLWAIGFVVGMIKSVLKKHQIDANVQPFLVSLLNISLRIALLISVASILGVETTSFVALVGAAGLAVGLALQGSLSNFAGSVLLLIFKPFKVGDMIQAQGFVGVVQEIQAFHTLLLTPDHRTIILPNGLLAGGALINYSSQSQRRIDFVFRVQANTDITKMRTVLLQQAATDNRFLKNPPPEVVISQLFPNAMECTLFVWVTSNEFLSSSTLITFGMNEKIKLAFATEGIVMAS